MKPLLDNTDFEAAAAKLDVEVAAIKAVSQVEAPRGGFNPDDSVTTLFEAHKFFAFTKGKWALSYPNLCHPLWDKSAYGKTWQEEQQRLDTAMGLDGKAACMSASWGKFQIMGFNYGACGFRDIDSFVAAMNVSEGEQLLAFIGYVKSNHLADELQRHDWAGFARGYNGSGQVDAYAAKLEAAYKHFATA